MKRFIIAAGVAMSVLAFGGTHAEAKPRHHHKAQKTHTHKAVHHARHRQRHHVRRDARRHRGYQVASADPNVGLFGFSFGDQADYVSTSSRRSHAVVRESSVQYLPHPPGCPARLFCGCGASYKIFGRNVRDLWLVRNWYRFRRASPSHGMAALSHRRGGGHVVVLGKHISGSTWMVYDYNSGGHQSRYHARDIAGYTVVDPRA